MMEYTTRIVRSSEGLTKEAALMGLQEHPSFMPGTKIANIYNQGGRWVAKLMEPKLAETEVEPCKHCEDKGCQHCKKTAADSFEDINESPADLHEEKHEKHEELESPFEELEEHEDEENSDTKKLNELEKIIEKVIKLFGERTKKVFEKMGELISFILGLGLFVLILIVIFYIVGGLLGILKFGWNQL